VEYDRLLLMEFPKDAENGEDPGSPEMAQSEDLKVKEKVAGHLYSASSEILHF